MSKINKLLKKLGPGLLFAGAAIGVSHLVQSTRAGAEFGMGLLWALILVNIFKYPFFQYGPRYASATGESLLDGYYKLGRGILIAYAIITLATMFTIQNWGLGLFFWGIGAVLDLTNKGNLEAIRAGNDVYDYTIPILMLVVCGVISIFLSYKLKQADTLL